MDCQNNQVEPSAHVPNCEQNSQVQLKCELCGWTFSNHSQLKMHACRVYDESGCFPNPSAHVLENMRNSHDINTSSPSAHVPEFMHNSCNKNNSYNSTNEPKTEFSAHDESIFSSSEYAPGKWNDSFENASTTSSDMASIIMYYGQIENVFNVSEQFPKIEINSLDIENDLNANKLFPIEKDLKAHEEFPKSEIGSQDINNNASTCAPKMLRDCDAENDSKNCTITSAFLGDHGNLNSLNTSAQLGGPDHSDTSAHELKLLSELPKEPVCNSSKNTPELVDDFCGSKLASKVVDDSCNVPDTSSYGELLQNTCSRIPAIVSASYNTKTSDTDNTVSYIPDVSMYTPDITHNSKSHVRTESSEIMENLIDDIENTSTSIVTKTTSDHIINSLNSIRVHRVCGNMTTDSNGIPVSMAKGHDERTVYVTGDSFQDCFQKQLCVRIPKLKLHDLHSSGPFSTTNVHSKQNDLHSSGPFCTTNVHSKQNDLHSSGPFSTTNVHSKQNDLHSSGPFSTTNVHSKPYNSGHLFTNEKISKLNSGRIHKQSKLSCDICGRQFRTNKWLRKHAVTHSDKASKPLYAPVSTTNKLSIREVTYPCSAGRIIASDEKSKLKTGHMNKQSKQPSCDVCGRQFNHKKNLRWHAETHLEKARKPLCDICGKRFSTKKCLKRHVATHKEKEPIKCDVCGKVFIHKGLLHQHNLVHATDKPFQCNVCGKKLLSRNILRHSKIHEKKLPVCHICGMTFSLLSNMRRHIKQFHQGAEEIKLDTSVPPCYYCDKCDTKFQTFANLENHYRIHFVDNFDTK